MTDRVLVGRAQGSRSTSGSSNRRRRPTPKWLAADRKANKNGTTHAVYWVKEKKLNDEQRLMRPKGSLKMWETGAVYEGNWKNNKKDGYGIQVWGDGSKYEGEWKRGFRHGQGVYWVRTDNGKLRKQYAGMWRAGKQEGSGVYWYENGARYEGAWKSGARHGNGTLFYKNGDVYFGEWLEDKQCGFGTLTRQNGDVYEGEWLKGKREGPGLYYYKSQEKIYDGEWVDDQPKCGVYCDAAELVTDRLQAKNIGNRPTAARFPYRRGDRPGPPLPMLRLADVEGVLSQQIETIQQSRHHIRQLPYTAVEDLFNEETLGVLSQVWEDAEATHKSQFTSKDGFSDSGDKKTASTTTTTSTTDKDTTHEVSQGIPVRMLEGMLAKVGAEVSSLELAHLLVDVDLKADGMMNYVEFVRAAHLTQVWWFARQAAGEGKETQ